MRLVRWLPDLSDFLAVCEQAREAALRLRRVLGGPSEAECAVTLRRSGWGVVYRPSLLQGWQFGGTTYAVNGDGLVRFMWAGR